MTTTRVTCFIAAPPAAVYQALLDPAAVRQWMVPDGMTSEVHRFDARENGEFEISLTYDDPASMGKTEGATDTFAGRFVKLAPGESVVQVVSFATEDPAVAGASGRPASVNAARCNWWGEGLASGAPYVTTCSFCRRGPREYTSSTVRNTYSGRRNTSSHEKRSST